jgi:hypothetical protein
VEKHQNMPPKVVQAGNGCLLITSEDFLNGYQAGHLTYMTKRHIVLFSDEQLTAMILEKLESMDHSSIYSTGFVVGWLKTFVGKGMCERHREMKKHV